MTRLKICIYTVGGGSSSRKSASRNRTRKTQKCPTYGQTLSTTFTLDRCRKHRFPTVADTLFIPDNTSVHPGLEPCFWAWNNISSHPRTVPSAWSGLPIAIQLIHPHAFSHWPTVFVVQLEDSVPPDASGPRSITLVPLAHPIPSGTIFPIMTHLFQSLSRFTLFEMMFKSFGRNRQCHQCLRMHLGSELPP